MTWFGSTAINIGGISLWPRKKLQVALAYSELPITMTVTVERLERVAPAYSEQRIIMTLRAAKSAAVLPGCSVVHLTGMPLAAKLVLPKLERSQHTTMTTRGIV